jgi:TIR domain
VYSRHDSAYVQRLARDLERPGKDVWVDVEGVRDAEAFPVALRRAIEWSDASVFVISPVSVRSEFCEQGVAHASELNKRIVPLSLREVPDGEIPAQIRVRNWIPAGEDGTVERMVSALDTDLDWEHEHTRLTVKALEWDGSRRDRSFLLRGSELAAAERWLAAGADKDPGPTALEQQFLLAARTAASRRQRTLVGVSLAVGTGAVGLLISALISRSQAITARNQARSEAQTAKSRALAAESQTQLSIDPERSILLASAAVRASPTSVALFALRGALDASPIRYRLPDAPLQTCNLGVAMSPGAAFTPDGRQIAEGPCDGSVVLADARTGTVIRRIDIGVPAGPVAYDRTGSLLVAAGGGRIVVIDPASGAIRERGPRLQTVSISRVVFSPHEPVVAFGGPGSVTLWNVDTGRTRVLPLLPGVPPPTGLSFSPDGRLLAVGLPPGPPGAPGLMVLDSATGRVVARSANASYGVEFSRDGSELAVAELAANGNGRIVVRDPRTLALRRTLVQLPASRPPRWRSVRTARASCTAGLMELRGSCQPRAVSGSSPTWATPPRSRRSRSAPTAASRRPRRRTNAVHGVVFTPDGRDVLSLDHAGIVREWDACTACEEPNALLALARTRATRQLTAQERQRYGPNYA